MRKPPRIGNLAVPARAAAPRVTDRRDRPGCCLACCSGPGGSRSNVPRTCASLPERPVGARAPL